MHLRTTLLLLAALVLLSRVNAGIFDKILPLAPGDQPPPGQGTTSSPTGPTTPAIPPVNNTSTTTSTSVVPLPPTNITSTIPITSASSTLSVPKGPTSIIATSSTVSSGIPTPTPTKKADEGGASQQLLTAGIVVGSVVVAAAIGIWVFRKWKLSPSRDFQSKIRGDDYTDYPRNHENDTVYLRNMDQPSEPAASKSPYNNAAAPLPSDDYYDPNYAAKDQGGYGQGGYGHNDYQNYDQGGYGHGGHGDYAQSQAGGGYGHDGYAHSQSGGYGQGGYNQGGYAQSNVGGGYQHDYNDYGRR
ncbi:hypothetical protein BG005_007097 [Podila minutissima]|nr:hypothetical protein BG005_007097 [Podila minutissima]